jgi:pimeloyl-ACP methyl ester carboxylesterase
MATFVLVPGAGGIAWYWHRVVPLLEREGHVAVAVDLPADDSTKTLVDYAGVVENAARGRDDVVLVASSLGGFVAAIACQRLAVRMLVFVNAMIPTPGETPAEYWATTGTARARIAAAERAGYTTAFDPMVYFFHDVPDDVFRAGAAHQRAQSETVLSEACAFERWPDVPIHVLAANGDRFSPFELQARVARVRVHRDVEPIEGGHLAALSHPEDLTRHLVAYARELL